MLLRRNALILSNIPLVHADYQPFLVALDKTEDIGVLALDASGGVDHQDADVGSLDGSDRADHRVVFDVFVDLLLLADTGCVDQIEVEAEFVVARIDGVACGTGHIGNDVAVFADEGVDERRFAGVGASHYGESGDILELFVVIGRLREFLDDVVEEVACAVAVGGAYGVGVAEAEAVKFGHIVKPVVGVYLVGYQDHRLARFTQDLSHMVVQIGNAVHGVDHEEDFVGLLDGDVHLLVDLFLEHVVGIDHPSAGVDDGEFTSAPFDLAILAVAGCSGRRVDYGLAGFGQAVEQRGFAHIRAPYYSYKL